MAAKHPRTPAESGTRAGPVEVGRLARNEREQALARLRRDARRNLYLIDLVRQVGGPPLPGESRAEVLAARRAGELVGVASARPTVVLEAEPERDALDPLLEEVARQATGLVRSPAELIEPLWRRLAARGRRAVVDRIEIAFCVAPAAIVDVAPPAGVTLRPARARDLAALVAAARASLREEGRPDPFEGDRRGFRRWVEARRSRALVGDAAGEIVFVGYADVRLAEGWLLQGVYTWPAWRRRGLAAAGISALCQAARAGEAEHVQLSVVEGNEAAVGLYEKLGFQRFGRLRTLLFV